MDDFDARRASLDLVTAFVNNNNLSAGELPTLLSNVFKAISGFEIHADVPAKPDKPNKTPAKPAPAPPAFKAESLETSVASVTPKVTKSPARETAPKLKALAADKPAVSIKTSLADPNVIISLITGEKFKTLKRHLKKHGLTEAEYKARFNLPDDYPMVASAYAELRRDVAKKMHARGKGAQPTATSDATPSLGILKETPKSTNAKPTLRKKTSAPKEAASSSPNSAKQHAVRSPRAAVVAANADTKASERSAGANKELAAGSASAPPVKVAEAMDKGAAPRQVRKRRMARQPATETSVTAPTPLKETTAQDQSQAASSKPRAGKSEKASGAPATIDQKAKIKPARKERKKLSPVFG